MRENYKTLRIVHDYPFSYKVVMGGSEIGVLYMSECEIVRNTRYIDGVLTITAFDYRSNGEKEYIVHIPNGCHEQDN